MQAGPMSAHLRPDEDAHATVSDEHIVRDVRALHGAHHVAHQLSRFLRTHKHPSTHNCSSFGACESASAALGCGWRENIPQSVKYGPSSHVGLLSFLSSV
eukprot:1140322-Pelagomonas_calceolata.AAC.4